MRKVLKIILFGVALVLIGGVVYKSVLLTSHTKVAIKNIDRLEAMEMKTQDKAIVAEISPTQGIKVMVDEDTSWSATLQILVILIGTYGGIKVINKYTRA